MPPASSAATFTRRSSRPRRWGASASPTTSARSPCSSLPTIRPGSPARRSSSPAGCFEPIDSERTNGSKNQEQTMSDLFTGKVAIVTGATSGIGKATALAFAQEGAKVAIAGRREEEGAAVVREIEQAGGEALFVRTDVSREAEVAALVAQTVDRFGRLDFAFNNAGVLLDAGPVT